MIQVPVATAPPPAPTQPAVLTNGYATGAVEVIERPDRRRRQPPAPATVAVPYEAGPDTGILPPLPQVMVHVDRMGRKLPWWFWLGLGALLGSGVIRGVGRRIFGFFGPRVVSTEG